MKKHTLFLRYLLFFVSLRIKAQPTDRPLDNFYVDQQNQEMHYGNVFTDSLENASKTILKLQRLFAIDTNEIGSLLFDSTYNMYSGRIKNLHIPYYSKGSIGNW